MIWILTLFFLPFFSCGSCFLRKRELQLSNTFNDERENVDVVLHINTAYIIDNGFAVDCGDLRFLHDGCYLNFFVEGECGTSETAIWMTIDHFDPKEMKNVTLLYDCDTTKGTIPDEGEELTFSGSYFSFSNDTSCPDGWSERSDLKNRFIKITPTYNGLVEGGFEEHTHIFHGSLDSYECNFDVSAFNLGRRGSKTHSHDLLDQNSSSSESSIAPFTAVQMCESTSFLSFAGGLIFPFNGTFATPSSSSIVLEYSDLNDRYPRIMNENQSVGDIGGSTEHSHYLYWESEVSSSFVQFGQTGADEVSGNEHYHVFDGYVGAIGNEFDYVTLPFALYNSNIHPDHHHNEEESMLMEGILMLITEKPPLGWIDMQIDGFYLKGGSSFAFTNVDIAPTSNHSFDGNSFIHSDTFKDCQKGLLVKVNLCEIDHIHSLIDYSQTLDCDLLDCEYDRFEIPMFKRKTSFVEVNIREEDFSCWNVSRMNTEGVCSGHGNCANPNTCLCINGYAGDDCQFPTCFNYSAADSDVCSGHGNCVFPNTCECKDGYVGDDCAIPSCYNYSAADSDVCSSHGNCTSPNTCQCESMYLGDDCGIPFCFDYYANDSRVCSGNGKCIERDTCDCDIGVGRNCTVYICFEYQTGDSEVCSGHGECIGRDDCNCDADYYGERCEKEEYNPLALIVGISVSSLVVMSSLILLFALCLICLICGSLLFIVMPLFTSNQKNKKKMDQFKGLKNLNLLLEEQKLEESTDMAHLRINKKLFQIEMKDITLKKILGEGGSNSVVYLVLWNGFDAAFKCFRTRMICSEQQNFDEFEKEVEILGSISHPNIIRYFGACLDPSRTGFVMEYCSNGDLNYFIASKKRKQEIFDMKEKIRMLTEISFAMSFLHRKKIIHRDLKLENVLLDATLTCKLMDFGASKFYEQTNMMNDIHQTKGVGTSFYMSPEIVIGGHYTNKVDVYSFGILMFVVVEEETKNPYSSMINKNTNIEYQVANNPSFRPKFKKEEKQQQQQYQEEKEHLKILCKKCWNHSPEDRPSFDEILIELTNQQNNKMKKKEENELFNFDENKDDGEQQRKEKNEKRGKDDPFLIISRLQKENEELKEEYQEKEKENEEWKRKYQEIEKENQNLKTIVSELRKKQPN